ncbi:hypothetical protein [Immundisolibacter sp.]|uniref:hypothetical protein n=1 Tax=Immundisolibacter sp. TaxID=1934948 RepID=UPI0035670AEC
MSKSLRIIFTLTAVLALPGAVLAADAQAKPATGEGAKISKQQFMEKAEARFARRDANKDGFIDASERGAMRQQRRQQRQDCNPTQDNKPTERGERGGRRGAAAGTDAKPQ